MRAESESVGSVNVPVRAESVESVNVPVRADHFTIWCHVCNVSENFGKRQNSAFNP